MSRHRSRFSWLAVAAFLAAAAYCMWMSAQTADLSFVPCHGAYATDHALPACRRPMYYAYGACSALVAAAIAAGVLLLRRLRKNSETV